MEPLGIFSAALGAFVLGSVWYMALADHWQLAARVPLDEEGNPQSGMSIKIFALSFLLQLVVATSLSFLFALSGVTSIGHGLLAGGAVGLLFITPWIGINNLYALRSPVLTLIDGGYATLACAVMGLILTML